MKLQDEVKALREEIARLRERIAVLESRPAVSVEHLRIGPGFVSPHMHPVMPAPAPFTVGDAPGWWTRGPTC